MHRDLSMNRVAGSLSPWQLQAVKHCPLPTCPSFPMGQGQPLSTFIPFPSPCIQIKGPLLHWLMYKEVSHLCQQLGDANSAAVTSRTQMIYAMAGEEWNGLCADTSACFPSAPVASLKFKEERTICPVSSLHPAPPEILTGGCFLELCPTWL